MHLFGHTFDHDYYFELPREGERDTQSITRRSTAHHRLFRVVPRANRTFSTARNSLDHLFALAAREQVPESRRDSLPARQALRCGQDLTQVKAHKIGYSETSTRQ